MQKFDVVLFVVEYIFKDQQRLYYLAELDLNRPVDKKKGFK